MKQSITAPVKRLLGPTYEPLRRSVYEPLRRAAFRVEEHIRSQPEDVVVGEAQEFWNSDDPILAQEMHWRGAGKFGDEQRWLAVGQHNVDIYRKLARVVGEPRRLHRVVEWGCGGGANAVCLAPLTDQFVGIDIASDSVAECGRQLLTVGFEGFVPVVIDSADPEAALARVPGPVDLFFCVYVFELLPTTEYGLRVLRIAHDLLADDGLALVQIKCASRDARRWRSYSRDYTSNTYEVHEFWTAAERAGFTPQAVTIVPHDPLVEDGPYAYFLLQKGDGAAA